MSKSVMISIKPRWCELIASGKKTVEIRKTRPKLETPFKCYIYETMAARFSTDVVGNVYYHGTSGSGKVIGEFICDKLVWVISHPSIFAGHALFHQKAIDDACLTNDEAEEYSSGKDVYGWHISDLKIYDEPKELRDFIRPSGGCCNEGKCTGCSFFRKGNGYNLEDDCDADFDTDEYSIVKRPPQSWCYVKEIE